MKTIYLIAFCLMAGVSFGQVKPDFRNLNWGMTIQQVKAKETSLKLIKSMPKDLNYTGSVLNNKSSVTYHFAKNKLCYAFFLFEIDNVSKNKYVEDYKRIQNQLTEKYGDPFTDEIKWREKLYQDDPAEIGMAIAAQHVTYKTEWYVGDMIVVLNMDAAHYKINIYLMYSSYSLMKDEIDNIDNSNKDEI